MSAAFCRKTINNNLRKCHVVCVQFTLCKSNLLSGSQCIKQLHQGERSRMHHRWHSINYIYRLLWYSKIRWHIQKYAVERAYLLIFHWALLYIIRHPEVGICYSVNYYESYTSKDTIYAKNRLLSTCAGIHFTVPLCILKITRGCLNFHQHLSSSACEFFSSPVGANYGSVRSTRFDRDLLIYIWS